MSELRTPLGLLCKLDFLDWKTLSVFVFTFIESLQDSFSDSVRSFQFLLDTLFTFWTHKKLKIQELSRQNINRAPGKSAQSYQMSLENAK